MLHHPYRPVIREKYQQMPSLPRKNDKTDLSAIKDKTRKASSTNLQLLILIAAIIFPSLCLLPKLRCDYLFSNYSGVTKESSPNFASKIREI